MDATDCVASDAPTKKDWRLKIYLIPNNQWPLQRIFDNRYSMLRQF